MSIVVVESVAVGVDARVEGRPVAVGVKDGEGHAGEVLGDVEADEDGDDSRDGVVVEGHDAGVGGRRAVVHGDGGLGCAKGVLGGSAGIGSRQNFALSRADLHDDEGGVLKEGSEDVEGHDDEDVVVVDESGAGDLDGEEDDGDGVDDDGEEDGREGVGEHGAELALAEALVPGGGRLGRESE